MGRDFNREDRLEGGCPMQLLLQVEAGVVFQASCRGPLKDQHFPNLYDLPKVDVAASKHEP